MSDKLTATLGLIITVGIVLAVIRWAVPMLLSMHEDWAIFAAVAVALGTFVFAWQSIAKVGPVLGFLDEKESPDE